MQEVNADSTNSRELPESIVIPSIRGEMARLRQATIEDLARMDSLHAFDGAAVITGKDSQSERSMVHAWVERSVQWSLAGSTEAKSNHDAASSDAQSRPTIAWSIVPDLIDDSENINGNIIGMIFLIDIDGWSKSARIQVILGRDYRGRGYSRDAMPRVMTYGFAPDTVGLALHRIWVGVPAANTRSLSVYQSLGFVK
ncbi:GNAT family N-acetyltransferase, partial [Gardnerella vaginalis]